MHPAFLIMIVAVVGFSSGLSLEAVAEGDQSKLAEFINGGPYGQFSSLFKDAQLAQVQSVWDEGEIPFLPVIDTGYMSSSVLKMISEAYIDFTIEKRVVTDPVTQSKFFANEVTQCIVQPKEALEFNSCMVCILEGTKKGEGPENQEIGKGEKEFPNGFPAGVPQYLPIQEINEGFSNDVRYVEAVKLQVCESPECVPAFLEFKTLPHGSREAAINTELASSGITVSADAYPGGEDEVIIFDADESGTSDRDLEVNKGLHLLIIPEKGKVKDSDNDGFVDDPDDSANGGTIFLRFDTPYFLESFVFVDKDNNKKPAEARAYDAKFGGNLIKTVPIPNKGNKSIQTIFMNAENIQRLEVQFKDSGGITNINLLCTPPEPEPECVKCQKPDIFTVKYNGPDGAEVTVSKKGKNPVTLSGTFNDGDQIVVDAINDLGKRNVESETTYTITNSGKGGTIAIHTSCSQTLFVGQEFFTYKGTPDEIKLTVVSGTLKGIPSIPGPECPVGNNGDDDHKKGDDDHKKGDDDHKKGDDDHKKGDDDHKTGDDDHKKGDDDHKKGDDDHKTGDDDHKTGDDDHKTGDDDYYSIDVRISKGSDDAEEKRSGSMHLFDKGDLDLAQKQIGLRFQNIEIPQGKTITKAYIQFTAEDNNEKQSAGVDIYAQDVDNAKTFSKSKNDITKRDKTSNSVNWFIPKWNKDGDSGQAQRTPDISSLVQEVVDRQGWSSGNSMAFVMIKNDNGDRDAYTYNGKPQKAATLYIEYSYSQQSEVSGENQFLSYTNEAYAETSDDPKTILEANFDSGKDGFRYFDDTFKGTSAPHYADGHRPSSSGFNGGALQVIIGGKDNVDVLGMSGGWGQIFTLTESKDVTLSFRYKLTQNKNYEKNEFSQVLVSVDGNLFGKSPNEYVAQLVGDGDGGSQKTTGWKLFEVNIGTLSAGDHDIIIGNFNNKKTYKNESTDILIDDVLIIGDKN